MVGSAAREKLYNSVWCLGVQGRNTAKRLGILGPFEGALVSLGTHLAPPPSKDGEVRLSVGMRMVVPAGFPSYRTYVTGLYEKEVTNLVLRIIREGMVVVDVGANIGYYTLIASALVGASGRVYAFEADPDICAVLQQNLQANGCRNVVAVARAVSDKVGLARFVRGEPERGYLSASPSGNAFIEVPTATLDAFFAAEGWPSIDLIKIDIEGGEVAALEGMSELSRRNPRMQLIMEFSLDNLRQAGTTVDALAKILEQLGFHSGRIIEQGMKPFSVARGLPKTYAVHNLLLKKE